MKRKPRSSVVVLSVLCLLLAACQPPPTPTPLPIGSQVAQRLTQTAAAPTSPLPSPTASPAFSDTPPPTDTPSVSPTPSVTLTPSITPTPTETGTATPPPRATVELGSLPYPPASFGGESHFYFGGLGGGFISSSYRYGSVGPGQRFSPHHGVDYSLPAGSTLVAVAAGTIYYAGSDLEREFGPRTDFYGNLVIIRLAQTWNGRAVFALYGHMDEIFVEAGQFVAAGEALGTVGATGVALGPHPHLEVRLDFPDSYWDTRNPELWLTPAGGLGTVAVRVTNAAGFFLPGVRVDFTCSDGANRFMDTYWYSGVKPDDVYFENAAMMNLPPGNCRFEVNVLGQTVTANGLVQAGAVSFVSIRVP
jgi:murein DD-endopeptidase MepM/ murein hydrolase activator NlpD